jgi:hypothetical protein
MSSLNGWTVIASTAHAAARLEDGRSHLPARGYLLTTARFFAGKKIETDQPAVLKF